MLNEEVMTRTTNERKNHSLIDRLVLGSLFDLCCVYELCSWSWRTYGTHHLTDILQIDEEFSTKVYFATDLYYQ